MAAGRRIGVLVVASIIFGGSSCTSGSRESFSTVREITSQLAQTKIACNRGNALPPSPARAKDTAVCQTRANDPSGLTPSFVYRVSVFRDDSARQKALDVMKASDSSSLLPCYLVGSNWVIEGQATGDLAPMKDILGGAIEEHSTYMCPDGHIGG